MLIRRIMFGLNIDDLLKQSNKYTILKYKCILALSYLIYIIKRVQYIIV